MSGNVRRMRSVAPALLAALLAACGSPAPPPPPAAALADLVILDADIRPMNPAQPLAHALAVNDGRILAVGDAAAVQPFIGAQTRVIHAGGHTVLPGLIDSH